MDGRNRNRISQTKVVKLINIRIQRARGVHFINSQHNRLPTAQQHIGHFLVRSGQTGFNITQKNNDRCVIDCDLRLFAHKIQNLAVGVRLNAARVHQRKTPAIPIRFTVDAVPGNSRRVLYNRKPLTDQFIEQQGLAHIGTPYDGNDGFCHWDTLPSP